MTPEPDILAPRALPNMSRRTQRVLRAVSWVIATAIAALLVRSVNVGEVAILLQRAHTGWIVAALCGNVIILPLWTQQWRALMPRAYPIEFRRMLPLVSMSALMGNTVPASGQISGIVLLASEPDVPYAAAVSVLALDQLVEGITKVAIVLGAAAFLPLPAWMQTTLLGLTVTVILLAVALILLANQGRWFQAYARELDSLRDVKKLAAAVAWCAMSKAAEALAIVAVQHAFGVSIPLSTTVVVLGAVSLGTMVPLAPANIGTYEACVMTVYKQAGLPAETALGVAIVQHVCLLLSTAGVGYLLFLFRDRIRNVVPRPAQ